MKKNEAPLPTVAGDELDAVSGGSLWSWITSWFKPEPYPCSPEGDHSRCLATVVKG